MHVVANVPFIPKEVVVLLSSRLRSSIPTRLSELGDVIRFIGLHGRTQLQHLNMLNYRSRGACMDLSSMYMSRQIMEQRGNA